MRRMFASLCALLKSQRPVSRPAGLAPTLTTRPAWHEMPYVIGRPGRLRRLYAIVAPLRLAFKKALLAPKVNLDLNDVFEALGIEMCRLGNYLHLIASHVPQVRRRERQCNEIEH
jgi:hypothetical protein